MTNKEEIEREVRNLSFKIVNGHYADLTDNQEIKNITHVILELFNQKLKERDEKIQSLTKQLEEREKELKELKSWLSNTVLLSDQTKTIIEAYFLTP